MWYEISLAISHNHVLIKYINKYRQTYLLADFFCFFKDSEDMQVSCLSFVKIKRSKQQAGVQGKTQGCFLTEDNQKNKHKDKVKDTWKAGSLFATKKKKSSISIKAASNESASLLQVNHCCRTQQNKGTGNEGKSTAGSELKQQMLQGGGGFKALAEAGGL